MVYVIIQEESDHSLNIIGFTWDTASVTDVIAEWLAE